MTDSYVLIGSGFGTDRTKVQLLEGRMTLQPSALVSISNERIMVRSRPMGIVNHSVVVSGRVSNTLVWTHPSERSIATPRGKNPAPALRVETPRPAPETLKKITITTGALQMTGLGSGTSTIQLKTSPLQMTGLGMGESTLKLTTSPLQMTGLGSGISTIQLKTSPLQMTGLGMGESTLKLTTSPLQMTGLGGTGTVKIKTKNLEMTGLGK